MGNLCVKGIEEKNTFVIPDPQRAEFSRSNTKSKPMLFGDFTIDPSYKVSNELLNELETNLPLVFPYKEYRMQNMLNLL